MFASNVLQNAKHVQQNAKQNPDMTIVFVNVKVVPTLVANVHKHVEQAMRTPSKRQHKNVLTHVKLVQKSAKSIPIWPVAQNVLQLVASVQNIAKV
jgi:hypothetical protein